MSRVHELQPWRCAEEAWRSGHQTGDEVAVVVGVFRDYGQAQAAVRDLIAQDFSSEAISVVGRRGGEPESAPAEVESSGTAIGVGTGTVLGGALAAMGLPVPGIGWLIAAGPLAAALAGASIGAAAGGVIGALVDIGVPSVEAEEYAAAVRSGATLVTVTVDDSRADAAMEILGRHRAVDVEERGPEDGRPTEAVSAPSTTDELQRDRARLQARDVRRYPGQSDDADFRRHHATAFAHTGAPYEDYAAAYAFGRDLAGNPHYARAEWDVMEPEARRQWQERCPGTWDRCRDAIHYGWQQSRQRRAA